MKKARCPGCRHRPHRNRNMRKAWAARPCDCNCHTIRRQADDARQQLTPGARSTPDGPPPSGVDTTLEVSA